MHVPNTLSRRGPSRALRHRLAPSSRQAFPDDLLAHVGRLVAEGERRHRGQVVLAVEARLPAAAAWRGQTPRQRADQVFADLRVWDTEANAGVLVYLLLADRAIEIVADRGLDRLVPAARWAEVCRLMEDDLRRGRYAEAVTDGVARVSAFVAEVLPRELPGQEAPPPGAPETPGFLASAPDGDPAVWGGTAAPAPGNELPDLPYRLD